MDAQQRLPSRPAALRLPATLVVQLVSSSEIVTTLATGSTRGPVQVARRGMLMPAVTALFAEHTRIIGERFHFSRDDRLVVGMRGIDQAVIFAGREYGGHQ